MAGGEAEVTYNYLMKNSSSNLGEQDANDGSIKVELESTGSRFNKPRVSDAANKDVGSGKFFLSLNVTALTSSVYVPISIASGKKTVGFIYQIEGTAAGEISSTEITCSGDEVTKLTVGTLLFAKIPVGKTAGFRMEIDINGQLKKEYRIIVNQVSYKLDPKDTRYKKLDVELGTKWLKFS